MREERNREVFDNEAFVEEDFRDMPDEKFKLLERFKSTEIPIEIPAEINIDNFVSKRAVMFKNSENIFSEFL